MRTREHFIKANTERGGIYMINRNGSITLSDFVGEFLVSKTYYFYTLKQAKREFKKEIKLLRSKENAN